MVKKYTSLIRRIYRYRYPDHMLEDVEKYVRERAVHYGYPCRVDANGRALLDPWGRLTGIPVESAGENNVEILIRTAYIVGREWGVRELDRDKESKDEG